ncbi:MAG: PEGA domain-containing protein [Methanoregula sp.]
MNAPSFFFLIAAVVAVGLLVPGAMSIPVGLTDGQIPATGDNTTIFLILDSAPEGLSGYNVNLSITDPLLVEVTSISFPPWAADLNGTYADPDGHTILIQASDVSDSVKKGATHVVLASVHLRGNASGTTFVNLTGPNFDDERGSDIPVSLKHSTVAINTTPVGLEAFNASLVSHTIPALLPRNRTVTVSITLNNTGLNPWIYSSPGKPGVYFAASGGAAGDAAIFGVSRVDLPENIAVETGQTYTFGLTMNVPNETGTYLLSYRMHSDIRGPFGPVYNMSVRVTDPEPAIRFTAPIDDNYDNETVTFTGTVSDPSITVLTIRQNSVNLSQVSVTGGNFSGTAVLHVNDVLTAGANTSYGVPEEAILQFDGDRLTSGYEPLIGFDPLNPDSDNSRTPANEAGNGIYDGNEKLDGRLPVFVKYRLGADPFKADTDDDGLTDEFELTRLGLTTNVTSADSDFDGVTDANEDADGDSLTNILEQQHGTDPLIADSDGDSLTDADEIGRGTNPLARDTDNDALEDDSEVRLGTNPLAADSNGNSVPDGNETFTSTKQYFGSSVELSVTGTGDAVKRVSVANVNYTHLIPDTILVSNVSAITFGNDTTTAEVRIHYFPAKVGTLSNLSMFVKNETSGSFDSMPFTLDAGNMLLSTTVTSSGEYCVMDRNLWDARFESSGEAVQQPMAMRAMTAPVTVSYSDTRKSVTSVRSSASNRTGLNSGKKISSDSDEAASEPVFIPAPSGKNAVNTYQSNLVYGTDYGPGYSENIPSWVLSEDVLNVTNTEIPITTPVQESLVLTKSSAVLYGADSGGTLYETVANGDFSQGMAAWAPSGPDVGSNSGVSWDVQPFNGDYISSPESLKLSITRPAASPVQYGYYKVAHANIDTSYASQLTFWFRCSEVYKHYSTNKFKLEVGRIDRGTQAEIRMYEFPSSFSASAYQNSWTPVTLDISNTGGGMQTFYFKSYYTASQPAPANTYSYVTFLIDDVSVQATEPPGTPTDASIRFHVYDAATGNPIQSGTVYVNRATGPESKPLKSNGYTDPFIFQTYGAYTFDVYTYGNPPLENQVFNVAKGQTGTIEVPIGAAPPQTGSLNVYSNPAGAGIYLDGNYLGLSPLTINDIPLGSHTLTATKNGYQDLTQTVTVTSGSSDIPLTLVPVNSDPDPLPDIVEVNGYKDPYGNTRTSDPTLADTDGDGLPDDYEAGDTITDKNGHTFWKVISNPRKVDSDDDRLFDPDELEIGTKPLIPDSDGDLFPDYNELEAGTDPLDKNTDGDNYDDFVEAVDLGWSGYTMHPLIYRKETVYDDFGAFIAGATIGAGGDLAQLNTDNPNYITGQLITSGTAFAVRDLTFSAVKLDGYGVVLNGLAIGKVQNGIKYLTKPVTNFVIKHPEQAGEVGKVILKYADDSTETRALLKSKVLGDTAYNRLATRFGDEATIVKLYEKWVNLKLLDEVFESEQIYARYPDIGKFIARTLLNEEGMATRVHIDLDALESAQKVGKPRSVQSRLGNIQGAYTEYTARTEMVYPGVEIIRDLSHINKPGLDLVIKQGNTIKIIECKAVKDLSTSNLRNYLIINRETGAVTGFNVNYAILQKLDESYFTDPNINKQFILYINSPESTVIKNKLNLPASVPYKYTKSGVDYSGTVQVTVLAVSK